VSKEEVIKKTLALATEKKLKEEHPLMGGIISAMSGDFNI
jgi:hypothetical protein